MLHITLYVVGKLKESFWRDACDEYLKRMRPYARITVIEIPDSNQAAECKVLCEKLPNAIGKAGKQGGSAATILLDRVGTQVSSEEIAHLLDSYALEGVSEIAFIIGGSDGVTQDVRNCATRSISFGKITLPHNLARVVLLEQLYRAFKILRGEPYHK